MCFQLQPFSRLMSRIFSVRAARFILGVSSWCWMSNCPHGAIWLHDESRLCSRHLDRAVVMVTQGRAGGQVAALARARAHHRHVARIELAADLGKEGAAATDEKIDDVVA